MSSVPAAIWPQATATIAVRPSQSSSAGQVRSPQLDRVIRFDSASWLLPVLLHLRSVETTGQNIPGIGDLRVARATADNVRRLLTIISHVPLPEPSLAPFSGGGVALTWNIGNRELSFTAYPDHNDFVFMQTNEDDELIDDGLVSLDQRDRLSDVITKFLFPETR